MYLGSHPISKSHGETCREATIADVGVTSKIRSPIYMIWCNALRSSCTIVTTGLEATGTHKFSQGIGSYQRNTVLPDRKSDFKQKTACRRKTTLGAHGLGICAESARVERSVDPVGKPFSAPATSRRLPSVAAPKSKRRSHPDILARSPRPSMLPMCGPQNVTQRWLFT